ncbi:MAG: 4,5-dihydroxyphthalate decarboxylase [Alphaproteobacteria bacterium]|jgi:4,5-dihydroxyphthalate decarboxylase|nr:4,5-dihydroxyphthalate decarboxylase [Alphaproteobacteria bacterium]
MMASSPDIPITVASGDYDRVRALRDGTVPIAGCAVAYSAVEANALFIRNLKNQEFDVSEMSFSTYITLKDRGAHHYTAVPVFLSRAFRHSAIFVRTDRIASPADLKGKRVGTPEYLTTMLVWMRGLLSDDYGIKPSDLRWRLGGMEQPSQKTAAPEPVPGVEIENIPSAKTLAGMLADGEIDAIFSARPPSCFLKGASNVGRLFADTRAVEQAYYRKSGVYPLMHAVGIRDSLLAQHPWLARAVFDAFLKAKNIAIADLQKLAAFSVTLPWVEAEYRATQAVLGADIWPYGLEQNRKAIETLCRYLHEQGFTQRRMAAEELFTPMG